uniref:VWFC domain-containing protein n=1 Tax=Eptatretus burgeri TaxID=7764 RepID=A0A8C4QKR3_EPTBU
MCICEPGQYRNSTGHCVIPALCECHDNGLVFSAGQRWQENCSHCHCVNGMKICQTSCPTLHCLQDEVKVYEPHRCCPVCRKEIVEQADICRRYTEVRNITQAGCSLKDVPVNYCSGRCPSIATVISQEPYINTDCQCCSYQLDPASPVHFLQLPCPGGGILPVVLPVIHSCKCSACQGEDLS